MVLSLLCLAAVCFAAASTGDWRFFVAISRQMTTAHGALVYAEHPNIQSGPLALLAVWVISNVGASAFTVVIVGLGVTTLAVLVRTRPTNDSASDLRLLIGGSVLVLWWPYLKTSGHLDDAVVLTLATLCLLLALEERRIPTAVLVGVMLAVKPWSLFLLPLTLTRDDIRMRRFRAPLISLGVGVLFWSPFLVVSSKTLDGLRPTVGLASDSVLTLLGFHTGHVPSGLRSLQLGLALAAVAFVVIVRQRPAAALLAGVAVRMALDPATWNYYTVGFIVGAVTWDLSRPHRIIPWTTLVACALLAPTWIVETPELRSILRLVACVGALVVVLRPDRPTEVALYGAMRGRWSATSAGARGVATSAGDAVIAQQS